MAYRCFVCDKKNKISRRSQHHKGVAGGTWKHKAQKSRKIFKANLHQLKVLLDKTPVRVKLCSGCLSKLKQVHQIMIGRQQLHLINYVASVAGSKK